MKTNNLMMVRSKLLSDTSLLCGIIASFYLMSYLLKHFTILIRFITATCRFSIFNLVFANIMIFVIKGLFFLCMFVCNCQTKNFGVSRIIPNPHYFVHCRL